MSDILGPEKNAADNVFLEFQDCTFSKRDEIFFKNLNWKISNKEYWCIQGHPGPVKPCLQKQFMVNAGSVIFS
jgi:ABC-type molybdenum transport system ATPase subunit/photorepair protein PhrA